MIFLDMPFVSGYTLGVLKRRRRICLRLVIRLFALEREVILT